jgi:hypothetical protein
MDASHQPSIPPEIMADAEEIARCVAAGTAVPRETAARVHERALRIRDEILQKHRLVDIGVGAIRELRGELPVHEIRHRFIGCFQMGGSRAAFRQG